MPASQWSDIPFDEPLFLNADEAILTQAVAAAENCYLNEAGGWSRFPGYKPFVTLPGSRTFLAEHRDDMIATTDQGRIYRISKSAAATDVTGVQLAGGRRPIFDSTEDRMVMAAGATILMLKGATTEVLSDQAPLSTHVVFVDGYLLAVEPNSGRFWYCDPGLYETWNDLSVFTAEAKPDALNATVVTPYNELLMAGPDSIEQFERASSGSQPFFRRYTLGEGIYAPYTLLTTDDGTYGVNKKREFVRFGGQVTRPQSDAVSLPLEKIDDWTDAWTTLIHIKGQRFILLQAPHARNAYDTEGITLLLDYRSQRWSQLFGWDETNTRPARWPAWSYLALWGRHFIGTEGGVQELDLATYSHGGDVQRMTVRTAHIDKWGPSRIDRLRLRVKRGQAAQGTTPPRIGLRVRRDNLRWSPWIWRGMGAAGDRPMNIDYTGMGRVDMTWQFEIQVADDTPVEFVKAQALVNREGW